MKKDIKTVVHVVQHLAPGGIESLALDFVSFSSVDHEVYIVSLQGTKQQALEKWPRLKDFANHLVFLNKPDAFSLKTISDLSALFRELGVDVVHTHHIGPLLYAGLAAKQCGIKAKLHTEHDVWHLNSFKHRQLQRALLMWVQPMVVADAFKVEKRLDELFAHSKLTTIHNGIDTLRFVEGQKQASREALNLPKDKTLIGTAGRLESVKGHDLLIQAISELPQQYQLAIAGDGSQFEALKTLTDRLGLEKRVFFLGRLENMPMFYQSLDLFCLPSRHEGFPLTAIEAQSCGTPTLVTDVGASAETLCPDSGLLVEANCSQKLAQAIKAFKPSSTSPREHVVNKHDIRDVVSRYQQLANIGA
ncbi:glycosyltransferase [Vibrio breoganii]|uniref:Glycosyl transferase n=1 Tax=Vibrio breoganii TaxID=553239 RepID=A0AAN1CTG4_9VIBR|nr:glycosyltransferase [Vibrio breoganii]ANO34611.1 glycosyl transferase [Vibrio breoganii]PMO56818.1 glycosyl transferase [Vibrio breoganii]